ncbi:SgcJ/EcaC family oxidoreductase [Amycolatopsis solani]|uniref:SgcJ/EcaC family oxidoreductase n=1 Tax=Amycolatopsis solani TaxID=3028615 RepID=UPI0025B1AA64|nr:SgcJ/EcaC family oxidoreductase [Amycolatopsis sp. MEP2-6]
MPATATEILASYGVEEDTEFYREFDDPRDRAALTVPLRITHAWKTNDADEFASVFTENGSLLMQDEQLTSREQIRAYMQAGFDGPLAGAHVKGWPLQVTFLAEDTALVITQGGIILDGETETAPARQIRATWIVVERDGEWSLLSHQSSPIRG